MDNEYGLNGIAAFIKAAHEYGVCIEYSEAFSSSDPPERLQRIVEIIKHGTSKVMMAFMSHREIKLLAKELYKQNITGMQWVGSDAWITDHSLTDSEGHSILVGSLGFTVSKAKIPGLEEHLRQLHPSQFPESQFVRDFWEDMFDCALNRSANTQKKPCSGSESLQNVKSTFTDVSELRFTHNVYKSVYAVAQALDNLIKCEGGKGLFSNGHCVDTKHIQPWQVRRQCDSYNSKNHHLMQLNACMISYRSCSISTLLILPPRKGKKFILTVMETHQQDMNLSIYKWQIKESWREQQLAFMMPLFQRVISLS